MSLLRRDLSSRLPTEKKSKSTSLMLILIIVVSIILALLLYSAVESQLPTVTVYRYTVNLDQGQSIVQQDLTAVKIPAVSLPPGVITKEQMVIGKHTLVPVIKGDYVLLGQIAEYSPVQSNLSVALAEIENGTLKGVALPSSSTAGLPLKVGDHVDISAISYISQNAPPTYSLIVQGAPVIFVPQSSEVGPSSQPTVNTSQGGSVVVALNDTQIHDLGMALSLTGAKLEVALDPAFNQ